MAPGPLGVLMAYATGDDLLSRYDARVLGDLVRDDGVRSSPAELALDEMVETALSAAEGELNSRVLKGNRYRVEDLSALSGPDSEFLKDIVCTLAFFWLHRRRSWVEISDSMREARKMVNETLKALSEGEAIFNLEGTRNAGVAKVEAVSRVELERDWNLLRDVAAGKFYPRRRTYRNG